MVYASPPHLTFDDLVNRVEADPRLALELLNETRKQMQLVKGVPMAVAEIGPFGERNPFGKRDPDDPEMKLIERAAQTVADPASTDDEFEEAGGQLQRLSDACKASTVAHCYRLYEWVYEQYAERTNHATEET